MNGLARNRAAGNLIKLCNAHLYRRRPFEGLRLSKELELAAINPSMAVPSRVLSLPPVAA
jgi:hypothetical protein